MSSIYTGGSNTGLKETLVFVYAKAAFCLWMYTQGEPLYRMTAQEEANFSYSSQGNTNSVPRNNKC